MHVRRRPALSALLPRRTIRLRLTVVYGVLFLLSGAGLLAVTISLSGAWSWSGTAKAPSAAVGRGQTPPAAAPGRVPRSQRDRAGASGSLLAGRAAVQASHDRGALAHDLMVGAGIGLALMSMASGVLGWLVAGRILRPLQAMTATARQISEDDLHRRLAMPGPADELKDLADTIDSLLARLEAAFDAQRTFVANASHELRTPLTLTRTLLQMALTDPRPTLATFRATCEEVLAAEEHQEQLIEALLTLARSQRGLDRHEFLDLGVITRGVLDACDPDAYHPGLTISAAVSTVPVLGDARLAQRLVANLVQNALRYNVPGGRVDIQVAVRGGGPRLTISNTGPVIPADQAGRLLQPFQRLSASRPADDDGLGLGLSVVAAIAKAHRASLVIEPGPGGGLDVEITFPAVASRDGRSGNGAAHASHLSVPNHRGATAARYLTVNAFRAEPAGVTDSPKPDRP